MEQQKERPIEIASLLNPAFCGQTILHCIYKFEKVASDGFPYPLVFLVLPLILHQETRAKVPSFTRIPFHVWLHKNQNLLIGFAERAKQLVTITKEAIAFLASYDVLKLEDGKFRVSNFEPKYDAAISLDVKDCFAKAEVLGKWFARTGTTATIYSMLGVQP
ncbi:MAG: three component ABC system middle component [Nitrosopumilaceae archaeon]